MRHETHAARMERLLRTLPPAVRGMGCGDPDDAQYAHASDVVAWAINEIDRLRDERRWWLTAREREEVQWAADAAYDKQHPAEDTLRAILARSTPPRVKVPHLDDLESDERPVWESACEAWIAAIREAGGEVQDG